MRPYVRPYRGALALGALLATLEVLVGLAQPWPLKYVVDDVLSPTITPDRPMVAVGLACSALAVIVALTALLDYWSTRLLSSTGLHLANGLRESTFAHLNRLSLRYHGSNRVGDLAARVTGDVDRTQDMIVQALAVLLPNVLLLVGMVGVMVVLDPVFAVLALALTPALGFAVHRSTRQLKAAAKRARSADGQVAAATNENLGAIHLVQAFSLEGLQEERFAHLARASRTAGLEAVRFQARFSPVVDVTSVISTIAVIWFGSRRVLEGRLTLGELLVFVSYVGSVYKPMKALSKLGAVGSKGAAAAERVIEVLNEAPQVDDVPGATFAPPLSGRIEFRDVSFDYGREPVLVHLDLAVDSGETVALVGPTGAGKSTIASLVARFADPCEGVVALDGVDVRRFALRSIRSQISMVLQDCTLLHGTLRDNIAVGRPWASEADVERAARLALVHEFSSRLPAGLDTAIGERGADLSGGQRQRIAIARAILRDAPILILDEPTSALDADSESAIIEALGNLPSNRTTLVIAHRLTTVRRADRIVVLESGRIVQQGTHDALLAVDGRYRSFHRLAPAGPSPTSLITIGEPR